MRISFCRSLALKVGRRNAPGQASVDYTAENVSPDMSFLEMLDVVNEGLIGKGEDPIAFDSDCREGICGTCGFLINGVPHGPEPGTTVCQLHMRRFKDGDTHHARAVARAGLPGHQGPGRRSQRVRSDHPGRRLHVGQRRRRAGRQRDPDPEGPSSEAAMDSAACIGCGACVAACKNASAALFTSAKVSHLALLPQGQVERDPARASRWSTVTTPRASAAARTKGNARRSARRRSRSPTSRG